MHVFKNVGLLIMICYPKRSSSPHSYFSSNYRCCFTYFEVSFNLYYTQGIVRANWPGRGQKILNLIRLCQYSVPVYRLHYNFFKMSMCTYKNNFQFAYRKIFCKNGEMILVFNCQLRWFDNKASCCPPLKDNVTKRVYSYFRLNSFMLILYDNTCNYHHINKRKY